MATTAAIPVMRAAINKDRRERLCLPSRQAIFQTHLSRKMFFVLRFNLIIYSIISDYGWTCNMIPIAIGIGVLNQMSALHLQNPLRLLSEFKVMRHQNQRCFFLAVHLKNEIRNLFCVFLIEVSGWLIGKQDLG